MLSGADLTDATLKLSHTGLVVYNINTTAPFQEGIYSWDGAKWNFCSSADATSADNGLTMSANTVKLGGNLTGATNINTNGNDLTISGAGKTTISSPLAITSGNPSVGKVLRCDASGNTSWDNISPTADAGTLNLGSQDVAIHAYGVGGNTYTNYNITVPPGRSVIYGGFNIKSTSHYPAYITFLLSTTQSTFTNFYNSSGNANNNGSVPWYSGFNLNAVVDDVNQPLVQSVGQITFYVNNTSTSNITLYIFGVVNGVTGTAANADLDSKVAISYVARENFLICAY